MASIPNTMNTVKSANNHLTSSKCCLMISLFVWGTSIFMRSSFQTELLTSTCTFPFQKLYVVGMRMNNPALEGYPILGYLPISQSYHYNISMYRSVLYQALSYARARTMGRADQYCIRPSGMLGLGQWIKQISTVLGLQLCQGQDNWQSRSVLYQAFSYARARTMGRADQYYIRPSAMLWLGQWVEQISTVLGLQLCQGQDNGQSRSVLYQAFSYARARTMGRQCSLTKLGVQVLSGIYFVSLSRTFARHSVPCIQC